MQQHRFVHEFICMVTTARLREYGYQASMHDKLYIRSVFQVHVES